jgi:hypothetical protein
VGGLLGAMAVRRQRTMQPAATAADCDSPATYGAKLAETQSQQLGTRKPDPMKKQHEATAVTVTAANIADAADYFFRKATKEVKWFTKIAEYKYCSSKREGILKFSGRLLDSGRVKAMEEVMFDLSPVSFCKPIVDKHSPVAYAIMLEMHWTKVNKLNSDHHVQREPGYRLHYPREGPCKGDKGKVQFLHQVQGQDGHSGDGQDP